MTPRPNLNPSYNVNEFWRKIPASMRKPERWPEPLCADGHDDEPRYKCDALGRPMFVVQCQRCGIQRTTFIAKALAYAWLNASYGIDLSTAGEYDMPCEALRFDEEAERVYWRRWRDWSLALEKYPRERLDRRTMVYAMVGRRSSGSVL